MRKIVSLVIVTVIAMMAYAVPAKRGWQTRTQADGTTIEVQQFGDEFYHYMINRDGKQVREVNGMYEVVGEAPTAEMAKARRAKGVARRQRKATQAEFGVSPYLPPKGVVIMVNFADKSFLNSTTVAKIDEMCNSTHCTVNSYEGVNYGSIAQYFRDQSDGKYNLQLDVYGPVTVSQNYSYYGKDKNSEGDDQYSGNLVIEACQLANSQIDFSQYDWNNDGEVDFVYIVYAGKGQADGGDANTLWPHSYEISSSRYYGYCTYAEAECKFDGKKVENYAMSNELSGSSLAGIGVICHEYGHVIGLPDHYDTDYSTNSNNELTPNEWDIMDGGSYNGDMHCPPNYNVWEKAFCGWYTPTNLGSEGQLLSLNAIGTAGYQAYQINASGQQQAVTTNNSTNYYIENRQQQGWDTFIPYHGLLIWKVNYIKSMWQNNSPNLTSNGNPHFTLVCSSGTKIGSSNGKGNVFPNGNKTSWNGISGKPLTNIAESNKVVTLTYIEEPSGDSFDITWMANGKQFATTQSTGKVVMPATNPTPCEGKVFVGWCSQADYSSATTAPTYVKAGDAVAEGATFYAVFAEQSGGGGEAAFDGSTGGTFKIYALVNGTKHYATGTVSNNKLQSTTTESEAADFVLTPANDGGFSIATDGKYLSNGSKTNVSLSTTAQQWNMESGTQGTWRVNSTANTGRALVFRAGEYNVFGAYSTSNINGTEYFDLEIGGEGGGASYSNYTTTCSGGTDVENVTIDRPAAVKAIRNGQLVIIRGEEVFSITGERIQ